MFCCGNGFGFSDRSVESHRCHFFNEPRGMLHRKRGRQLTVTPRSCPFSGAAACTYQRWFRHRPTQEHVLGGSWHAHARSSSRTHQLQRFRLGCHTVCPIGPVLRASELELRGTLDTVLYAVREWQMRNVRFLSVSSCAPFAPCICSSMAVQCHRS